MIDKLIENLHTPDPSDRRSALEALYDFACDPRVLEAASYLLTDEDRGVREAASHLIVLCSNEKAAELTAAHISSLNIAVRNLAGDVLVRMKSASVSSLLPYIDSADKDVRKFAIDVLAQLPSTAECVRRIAGRLHDIDSNVVCSAIDALGSLHAEEYLDQILKLYDEAPYARPNVVNAAGKFVGRPGLEFFANALSDEDPIVQLAAAESLSTRRDEGMLALLLEKLNTVSDLARPVILHSIVVLIESENNRTGIPPHLRDHFVRMLDDSDPAYVRAAVRGLRYFMDENTLSLLIAHAGMSESVDSSIASVLKDQPEAAIYAAARYLESSHTKSPAGRIIIAMTQALSEEGITPKQPRILDEAASALTKHFSDFDAETKMTALGTCGFFQAAGAVRIIKAGLEDGDLTVKGYALDLAAQIGPKYFEKELGAISQEYDDDIRLAASALIEQLKTGFQN